MRLSKILPSAMVRRVIVALFLGTLASAQERISGSSKVADVADNHRPMLVDVIRKTDGAQVNGLAANNFRATVDGKPSSIIAAERVVLTRPTVLLLLDCSGSMAQSTKWNAAIDLAEATVRNLSGSQIVLMTFSDNPHFSQTFSATQDALNQLEMMRSQADALVKGRTALRDAMAAGLRDNHLRFGDAIVTITDGGDNRSKETAGKLIVQLQQSRVRVFSIKLAEAAPVPPVEQDAEFDMREMSEKTGGGWLPIGSERGLDRNRYFELSDKERGAIQAFGKYIAERVLKPYLLQLDLSPQASGKLKLQIIDNSGVRDKKLDVVAPDRLLELVP